MLSLLGVVTVALVAGSGRWWFSLEAVFGAIVAGSGLRCSRRWERPLLLLSLGAVFGALVAGSGRCCSLSWERSLVALIGSGRR